jgi:hypothetical protein
MTEAEKHPVLVIGAGPAGLAVSRELLRLGVGHRVLEAGRAGESWRRYYRSLVLHTGRHLSTLPGLAWPRATPLFPSREAFVRYLETYAAHFRLPLREQVRVTRIRKLPSGEGWEVETSAGIFRCRALVVATGIASNPHSPRLPGEESYQGNVLHSSAYAEPSPYRGKRVLVIGVGNSGGEIAAELAKAGAHVAVCVRSGAHLMPLRIFGVPAQYWSVELERLPWGLGGRIAQAFGSLLVRFGPARPLPLPDYPLLSRAPLIGDSLPAALRSGAVTLRGPLETLTLSGARFRDGREEPFDAVLSATGFRAALGFLDGLVPLGEDGFPRAEALADANASGLFFAGHRYGPTGALYNIRREAPRIARGAKLFMARFLARIQTRAG